MVHHVDAPDQTEKSRGGSVEKRRKAYFSAASCGQLSEEYDISRYRV